MSLSWPTHLLTLDDWEALPEDERRWELAEGVLQLVAAPPARHQRAGMRLGCRLDEQLPTSSTALVAVEVVVLDPPPTIRVPDVVVTTTAVYRRDLARLAATDVQLAVEILSDGTRRVDRMVKFAEYAEAGIAQYWIIDIDEPASLLAYVLVDGAYELSGEHTGTVTLDVAGHPVTLDLAALTTR